MRLAPAAHHVSRAQINARWGRGVRALRGCARIARWCDVRADEVWSDFHMPFFATW